MAVNSATSHDSTLEGIPLDLGPVLEPYLQRGQLSVKIEQLPQLARLSKGRNNGDCTYSLKSGEFDDVFYLPPEGTDGSGVVLAVRIINLDGEYASTIAMVDLEVAPGTVAESPVQGPKLVAEPYEVIPQLSAETLDQVLVNGEPERAPEVRLGGKLDSRQAAIKARANARALAQAQKERSPIERSRNDSEELEHALKDAEARVEVAEKNAEEAAELLTALATRSKEAETTANETLANAREEFEQQISGLQDQLANIDEVDVDAVRVEAAKVAEAAHAQALEQLQRTHAQELERHALGAKDEQEKASSERITEAVAQAEKKTEQRLTEAQQVWKIDAEAKFAAAREKWDAEKEVELAAIREAAGKEVEAASTKLREAAREEYAQKLSRLQAEQSASTVGLDDAREQALAAASAVHTQEITELQAAHARELETQLLAAEGRLEGEFESRLAAARRQVEENVEDRSSAAKETEVRAAEERLETKFAPRLDEMKRQTEEAAEQRLQEARKVWQASVKESEERLEREFVVRQSEAVRLAEENAARQSTRTGTADSTAIEAQLQGDFERRLVTAVREAEEKAECKLVEAREVWEAYGEDSQERLERSYEDRLTDKLNQAEEKAEQNLAEARKAWEASTEETLAAARETWKAEKAERLGLALKMRQGNVQRHQESKPSTRELTYRRQSRSWRPRRSLVFAAVIAALIAVPIWRPDVTSLVVERTTPAIADIKTQIAPLLGAARETVQAQVADRPVVKELRATVEVANANVRAGPSRVANVIESLRRGRRVTLLGAREGDWLQVRFGNGAEGVGWVFADLLSNPSTEDEAL